MLLHSKREIKPSHCLKNFHGAQQLQRGEGGEYARHQPRGDQKAEDAHRREGDSVVRLEQEEAHLEENGIDVLAAD
jgi:hypothetical protein